MTISGSAITVIPKIFSGLRVLLVEPEESLLQHHAYILTQNSYQVTSTTKAVMGLSMIMNGPTYDCVLLDADMCDMDTMAFLQVLQHQPQLSLIMMASDDIHLRMTKESLENEAVMCLLKPCSLKDLCNIWKHICRKRIAFQQNVLKGNLHIEDQVKPSTIINTSAANSTDEYAGVVCKQITYEDLFSDDDDDDEERNIVDHEITGKGNIVVGSTGSADKGKQPLKRKHEQEEEEEDDDEDYKERKEKSKTRIRWTSDLHDKFLDALNELGEQAHSSSILKHMNVAGLTRYHVASHLQKHKLKQMKNIEPSLIRAPAQRGNYNLQVESSSYYTNKIRFGYSSPQYYNNNIIRSSISSLLLRSPPPPPPPMLNSVGNSYMTIDNIGAKLQGSGLLAHELSTTTPITNNSNYGSDETSNYSLGSFNQGRDVIQMIGGHDSYYYNYANNAMEPQLTAGEYDNAFQEASILAPSGNHSLQGMVDDNSSWGAAAEDALDCFEPLWDDLVPGGNAAAAVATTSHDGPQDLLSFLPQQVPKSSCDVQGRLFPELHVNEENLSWMSISGVDLPIDPSGLSKIDSVVPNYGVANTDFCLIPNFSPAENNAAPLQPAAAIVVPSDGSECMDDGLFLNMS